MLRVYWFMAMFLSSWQSKCTKFGHFFSFAFFSVLKSLAVQQNYSDKKYSSNLLQEYWRSDSDNIMKDDT